jgi:SAM-dependent methyltransferase
MPRTNTQRFYYASFKKYGSTPQGVQWSSKKSQHARFQALVQLLPSTLHIKTLLDVGCGFGDFYLYLCCNNNMPKEYVGIDQLPFMCAEAIRNTQQTILQRDATTQELVMSDYVVCSGALNILTKFESYQFITNCYQHAREGFIFNALFGKQQSATYNYFQIQDIKNLAKSLGVKNLRVVQGYMPHDITIGFYR